MKTDSDGEPEVVSSLAELVALVERDTSLYIHYGEDPGSNPEQRSVDAESGLQLPGLSVNPLAPEDWWTRPAAEWVARQVCQYGHLRDQDPGRRAWVLAGTTVGRGPDCEPLIASPKPVARLDDAAVAEAERLYRARFAAGRSGAG